MNKKQSIALSGAKELEKERIIFSIDLLLAGKSIILSLYSINPQSTTPRRRGGILIGIMRQNGAYLEEMNASCAKSISIPSYFMFNQIRKQRTRASTK